MDGSGKSIAVQLKFIEYIEKWKLGDPLPIYFNLANGIQLEKIFQNLNNELRTNLTLGNLKGKGIQIFADSFDEGLGINSHKETLIKEYFEQLLNPKIIVSCRTDYLSKSSDEQWFEPQSK